ncbi:MAG TPA: DUF58 domain-containing protein [Rheinheimera sp.]|nr:DUF58 domain-containing protein [Rheinheimera sp.]
MTINQRLRAVYWRLLNRYLDKKQPVSAQVTLVQKLIFILPTRYGWWFLLLISLLYLLGTNYQNNLILLLCYFLLILFLFSIVLCYKNLSGLTLRCPVAAEGFCSDTLDVELVLSSDKQHVILQLNFIGQTYESITLNQQSKISLPLETQRRGKYPLPRIRIFSQYPFGLWRAWSYIALDQYYWVYPKPDQHIDANLNDNIEGNKLTKPAGDMLSPYRTGDSLRYMVWKRLARDPLNPVVRQQHVSQTQPSWVVIPKLSGDALEHALNKACYQLLALEQSGTQYGLKLPQLTVAQSCGKAHLTRCLQELALC